MRAECPPPLSTVFGLMNGGERPGWKIGRQERCPNWRAMRMFIGDAPAIEAG